MFHPKASDAAKLEAAFSLLHCYQVHQSFRSYHQSLQDVTNIFQPDPNWNILLRGTGFDNSYPMLRISQSKSFESHVSLRQERPKQKAIFLHNKVTVLQNHDEEYKLKFPLLFYTKQSDLHPANVKLWLSSRTHSLVQRNHYSIAFDKAINVKQDENGLPRFFLSSTVMKDEFEKSESTFIMVHSEELVKLPASLNRLLNDDANELTVPKLPLAESTYGVSKMIGFRCPQWPLNAQDWPQRKRYWPNKSTVSKVMSLGFHITPATSQAMETDEQENMLENEWTISFSDAEYELLRSLNHMQHTCLVMIKHILLDHPSCIQLMITEKTVNYGMFWILEQESNDVWNGEELLPCLKYALKGFQKLFVQCLLPHYFIPEINMFAEIPNKDDLRSIGNDLRTLIDSTEDLFSLFNPFISLVDIWDLQPSAATVEIQSSIAARLNLKFTTLFDESVKLFYVKLYASITLASSLDMCIAKTKDAVQHVAQSELGLQFTTPMKEILTNILGNLYLVKAMATRPSPERKFFANKAEECLLLAHNMDLLVGKVKLANFFYMTSRFSDCIQLLQEVLQHTGQQRHRPAVRAGLYAEQDDRKEDPTRTMLWQKWLNKNYVFGFLLCRLEKSVIPSVVKKNVDLAGTQMLGFSRNPLSFFDPDIYARILLALSLIKLKRNDEALVELDVLENVCEKEHEDMNEKRNVAYLNIVAYCYEQLGERARTVHNLCRSVAILPNPRNPGRWMLTGIQTEKARLILKGSVGAAAAVGVVAMLVAIIKGRGQ